MAVKELFDTGVESQRQFEREARLLAKLRHPNLPTVFDHFVLPEGQYLIMEFVEGKSLHEMLIERGGPLGEAEAVSWIRQVADALEYLHTRTPPVIHRDIKPENIIVTHEGRAMLVDFGISKLYDPSKGTTVGAAAVTPGYSPLEQYGRGRTDPRSDVYSLGATLYSLLTGKLPPEAPDLSSGADVLTPPREVNPAVREETSAAVVAAMEPTISQRLVSADALRTMLPHVVSPPSVPSKFMTVPLGPPPSLIAAGQAKIKRGIPIWGWVGSLVILIGLAVWAAMTFGGRIGVEAPTISQHTTPSPTSAAAVRQPTTTPVEARVVSRGEVEVEQVFIPAGSFRMGSNFGDKNEQPVHVVRLDGYWIDKTEVTNGQYQQCVEAGICDLPAGSSSNTRTNYYFESKFSEGPVVQVSWNAAYLFCQWAGGRLPTEAEWEYAARGRNLLHYPWGSDYPKPGWANLGKGVNGDTILVGPSLAALRDKSWSGVWGMAGNVREWVSDWYGNYKSNDQTNPIGAETGTHRVVKGGSWYTVRLLNARPAARGALMPNEIRDYIGFRCVQD